MTIDISKREFDELWKSTGEMIKESKTTFVQTYAANRVGVRGKRFKQVGKNNFMGGRVFLEEVKVGK